MKMSKKKKKLILSLAWWGEPGQADEYRDASWLQRNFM